MLYLKRLKYCYAIPGLMMLLPLAAKPSAVMVNGVCLVGFDCTAAGLIASALGNGQSTSGSVNSTLSFGDGDTYSITGGFGASYSHVNGSTIFTFPVVTYTGAGPSAGNDTIDFMLLQDYVDPLPGTWAGSYTETVDLKGTGTFGAGSTMSGQLSYDGVGLPLVGPFAAPGSYSVTDTLALDFGGLDTSNVLAAVYDFDFAFKAGTQPGASAASPTPEPVMMAQGGLALLAFGGLWWQQRRRKA